MTVRTFVDTNIWVYAFGSPDGAKRARARAAVSADPANLWTSPQVMGELYVTLTRKGARPLARAAARAIVEPLAGLNVAPLEAAQVVDALEIACQGQVSYWDALIVASARAAGCERILTEDLASGARIAGVRVENPFLDPPHRLAEMPAAYVAGPWDDHGLRAALTAYDAQARSSGMTPTAVHSYWDYARRFLDWREGRYPRRAQGRPVRARQVTPSDLHAEVDQYERHLRSAGLRDAAIETYVRHARFFARWLAGDFTPGARLAGRG